MERYDLIVIGAGPAGLSAAIRAASCGMHTLVVDENARPGGQLFKQIHKFFGSKEHHAKERGFRIGKELLDQAEKLNVKVLLNAPVIGLYPNREIMVRLENEVKHYRGDNILVATGASERAVAFDGWTLPGVIGAGAAQTMMNLHHVRPGQKILMLGTGNVGLVVSFQLLQAGCEIAAIVDALPRVGGYGVHAAKLARLGVPFYLSHTIIKAEGEECVTGVTIAEVGSDFKPIVGSEKHLEVDTICLAVGLSPAANLLAQAGCTMVNVAGTRVPVCDENGKTSITGIYAAGDVTGIEEASSAMIEGAMSGIEIARENGFCSDEAAEKEKAELLVSLEKLREGMFAPKNRGKKIEYTEEGAPVSVSLLENGYMSEDELENYPGIVKKQELHPVIECSQNIPCNPCQEVCRFGCIDVGEKITSLPRVNKEAKCAGCGLCVAACPGQAIFLVKEDTENGFAEITLPYEFLPLPEVGDIGMGLDRSGKPVCRAEVAAVRSVKQFDATVLLTIKVPIEAAMKARFYKGESV